MRAIVVLTLLLPLFLFADFTISYLIDNKIKQTVYYKDNNHIMFKIEDNEKILEKLLIINGKKYLTFNENNIEYIYEISDELEDISNLENNNSTIQNRYNNIIRVDSNITFNNLKATRWIIKNSNQKESIIVTKNPQLYKDLQKTIKALKKILPKNKENEASIFDAGNGYTILKNENLELLSYKKEPISLSLFQINYQLTPKEQKELSKNIQKCFTTVCCGQTTQSAQEIEQFLNKNTKNWKFIKSAKCKEQNNNIESAIYKYNNSYLTVELISQNTLLGKIDTLEQEGFEIQNLKKDTLNGYKIKEAYLPSVDATVADITLPNATISIYTKGNKELKDSIKELIKLKLNANVSLNN